MHGSVAKKVATLDRATFSTSRLLDFASENELVKQTGHPRHDWPLVIIKELVDNALDACETAGGAPALNIVVSKDGIKVTDNGPGIPAETVKGALDFYIRVSSNEAYVSPTRGAQGNALKTIFAMPFVLDGKRGNVEIDARGCRHAIDIRFDHIKQDVEIDHTQNPSDVKSGTVVTVRWPDGASSILADAEGRILQIVENYTWLNPHLSVLLDLFGNHYGFAATDPSWTKWKPTDPTSPHWYPQERFERLIAAYINDDGKTGRERTVREFVSEFKGLSASAKQKEVLDSIGLSRARLADLVKDGAIDSETAVKLLHAMKLATPEVKPKALGIIGKEHFRTKLEAAGCEMDSFEYKKIHDIDNGVPWLIEMAFGYCPPADGEGDRGLRLVTGVNWSPGIANPFRHLKVGRSLDSILSVRFVRHDEPIVMVVHYACALVEYQDRGKSSVVL